MKLLYYSLWKSVKEIKLFLIFFTFYYNINFQDSNTIIITLKFLKNLFLTLFYKMELAIVDPNKKEQTVIIKTYISEYMMLLINLKGH